MQAPAAVFDGLFSGGVWHIAFAALCLTLKTPFIYSPGLDFLNLENHGMPKFLLGRRQFALGAAAAATTALIPKGNALAIDTLAQAPAPNPPVEAQSLDQKTRAAMAKLSASAQAEVEMKVASIFRKYGDRLSDEQKADIRRIMAESQEGLEKMRAFKLENGDQPADAFRAYRSEAKVGAAEAKLGAVKEKPSAAKENSAMKPAQARSRKENK